MTALENRRMEALAQGLADGLALHAATAAAGYSRQTGESQRRAARADVQHRLTEIAGERRAAAAALEPVIDKLMDLAAEAGKLGTAAGMAAARGLLSEAARVKLLLPPPPQAQRELPPQLTTEEWVAKYAHLGAKFAEQRG
jgi:hypothetical protein